MILICLLNQILQAVLTFFHHPLSRLRPRYKSQNHLRDSRTQTQEKHQNTKDTFSNRKQQQQHGNTKDTCKQNISLNKCSSFFFSSAISPDCHDHSPRGFSHLMPVLEKSPKAGKAPNAAPLGRERSLPDPTLTMNLGGAWSIRCSKQELVPPASLRQRHWDPVPGESPGRFLRRRKER